AQSFSETVGIAVHFPLVHQALFTFVNEFDGVFNSENVVIFVLIKIVHHGSKRGGFTGTGGTSHQYQATWYRTNVAEDLDHTQLFHGENFGRNRPEYRTGTAVLVESVDPEARHPWNLK